ncbi:LysR family transcriptional regulator (plasmid) [Salipiger sp. H15]|uniref:LysR family transcriptional regulator n=1 Tax=Alloyangia sp. H15 TaxID=3029062 RepID=A0AAU8ASB5_9RHOB
MPEFSREIYSFVEIARERSIRRAADKLNISSSALSRQMNLLEADLGVSLLTRQVTGVQLTEHGTMLLQQVEKWLEEDMRLRAMLAKADATRERALRIGAMECFADTLLPELSLYAQAQDKADRMVTKTGGTAELLRDLENGKLDLVIAFNVHHSQITRVLYDRDCRIGMVFRPGLLSIAEEEVPIARALDHPICLPDENLSLHTRLYSELLKQRRRADIHATSNSIAMIREMAVRGDCVSFLTWFDVHRAVARKQLCFVPLAERRLSETLCVCVSGMRPFAPQLSAVATEAARLIEEVATGTGTERFL